MSNGTDLSPNRVTPVVDFTSGDFDSIRADLITYAQANYTDRWTDFNLDQFAVVFLELVAYFGDLSFYHINASVREVFAATAIRLQNLYNIGKPFGIQPSEPSSATATVTVGLDVAGTYPFTITKTGNLFSNGDPNDEVFFHPSSSLLVPVYVPTVDVPCTEGEYFEDELIGVSDGSPNQRWQFPQDGVLQDGLVIRVGAQTWEAVTSFVSSSGTAPVYKIVKNDAGETFAVFGEGVFGAIPPSSAEIRATFRNGGGSRGNVAKNLIQTIVSSHANILSVNNNAASSGGQPRQTLKEARNAIPGSLSTLERGVTGDDYATLARAVAGVAKALGRSGSPVGSRIIETVIAPAGGGEPSTVLKNTVLTNLAPKKMITNRIRAAGPTYKQVRLEALLHVNPTFRELAVEQRTRFSVINANGSGIFDFDQLDFRGIDSDGQLIVANTPLQDHFATLKMSGLDRVEVVRLDVLPQARARREGNSGSGFIADSSIVLDSKQRRRQFLVELLSASSYAVYERIIGYVEELTDTTLTDETKVFENEGVADFTVGYKLMPDISNDAQVVDVASAAGQVVTTGGGHSLFTLTSPGTEYALFLGTPTIVAVDSEFTSADGTVRFTLASGTTPFINGDSFTLDIFPVVGDIRLREDEYPQLLEENFLTRTSGGA